MFFMTPFKSFSADTTILNCDCKAVNFRNSYFNTLDSIGNKLLKSNDSIIIFGISSNSTSYLLFLINSKPARIAYTFKFRPNKLLYSNKDFVEHDDEKNYNKLLLYNKNKEIEKLRSLFFENIDTLKYVSKISKALISEDFEYTISILIRQNKINYIMCDSQVMTVGFKPVGKMFHYFFGLANW